MSLVSATLYLARRNSKGEKVLHWIHAKNGHVPDGAVEVGHFGGRGGETMYIGRVTFLGTQNTIPGTVIPSKCGCFFAWNGCEFDAPEYEVLVNTAPDICRLHWAPTKSHDAGVLPREAVKGGYDLDNDDLLYITRARPPGGALGTHVGYVRYGEAFATMSYEGEVRQVDDFKILCRTYANHVSRTSSNGSSTS